MNNKEFVIFLKTALVKIENVINLLHQHTPKHIPAYHKALGVQQKINGLCKERREQMFSQIITVRSVINYLLNGRYNDASEQVLKLKKELIQICVQLENENNRDK